jgi:hypothetical protein
MKIYYWVLLLTCLIFNSKLAGAESREHQETAKLLWLPQKTSFKRDEAVLVCFYKWSEKFVLFTVMPADMISGSRDNFLVNAPEKFFLCIVSPRG